MTDKALADVRSWPAYQHLWEYQPNEADCMARCNKCNNYNPCRMCQDPYLWEVCDRISEEENPTVPWCKQCYVEKCEAI